MQWTDPATLALLGAIGALFVALGKGIVAGIRIAAEQPFAIIRGLRAELASEIAARERLQRELMQVAAIRSELEQMRVSAGRLSLAAARGLDGDALMDAWDHCSDGVVLSEGGAGGTWTWVNRTFAEALGLPRDEILSIGWRNIVDPAALHRTQVREGSAYARPVRDYVVHYRRSSSAGGGTIQTRWWCAAYDEHGNTFCIVKLEVE